MAPRWTKDELKDYKVKPEYHHPLASIFEKSTNSLFKSKLLSDSLKVPHHVSDSIIPIVQIKLKPLYDAYTTILEDWLSRNGSKATFEVLFDALNSTEVGWTDPIDKILEYEWEGIIKSEVTDDLVVFDPTITIDDETDDQSGKRGIDWVDGPPLKVELVRNPSCPPILNQNYYKMTSNPRGLAWILNNEFKNTTKQRDGSDIDCKYMGILFQQLGFTTGVSCNLKSTQLKPALDKLKSHITKEMDCLVLVVMTHGELGCVEMEDFVKMNIYKDIIYKFDHKSCPEMKDKPKIFIFQACQEFPEQKDSQQSLQIIDVLICFAAKPGQNAYRKYGKGSRFIYALTKVLMERSHNSEIQYMLNELLMEEMKEMRLPKRTEQQVPCTNIIGGFRPFYFNPPVV